MDVVKQKQQKPLKKWFMIGGAVAATIALFTSGVFDSDKTMRLERSQIITGEVIRGDLEVTVDGYGVLRSNRQKLITAQSPATIYEILLRPGANVTPDSVILKMQDPDLTQQIDNAEMELNRRQADLRRQKLANQREQLSEEALLAQLTSEHQSLVLRREAEQILRDQGVVPEINVKTAKLEEEQLGSRIKLQEVRINQLQQLHREDIKIAQEQINQADSILQRLRDREDELTVRAGVNGVLQRLPVELGQSVVSGQELAQVGSSADLQALVRVSQAKAEQIRVGQLAMVNTRREQVAAEVTRISPQVQEGTIEVELSFVDGVPASARPELNVDAKIQTHSLKNTLYVERPSNTQSHSQNQVFVIEGETALPTSVTFGVDAGKFIQIESGISEYQQVILSDMTQYRSAEKIRILQ